MDIQRLFEIQAGLDYHINKEHPVQDGEDRLAKKILALQIELGECANELPEVFKFWSNKKNNYEKALVEYCDCLHFILSIGLELGYEKIEFVVTENEFTDTLEAYRHVFNWCVNLDFVTIEEPFVVSESKERIYQNLIKAFVWLGEKLGFTWEEVEKAYFEKNKINHERQASGY